MASTISAGTIGSSVDVWMLTTALRVRMNILDHQRVRARAQVRLEAVNRRGGEAEPYGDS